MAYAKGKYAMAVSDRSGMAFPYTEMVKEWNGSFVHQSEFEAKHPQLDPKKRAVDNEALKNARPEVTEYPSAQIQNGYINNLHKTLGHTAKTFEGTFGQGSAQDDNASPLATALTISANLGSESVSTS
tara:strand:- start:395 stop:778 length:384 start_codon:yes stop_codon:yes gene_type:complete